MKNKLIYVITSLDYGGTQKQLYYIVRMLKNLCKQKEIVADTKQIEPIIISLKRGGKYREKFISLGTKIYDLGMSKNFNLLTIIFFLKYFLKFVFIILKEKPFIVHSFLFQANIFTIFVKIFSPRCKIILSERVAEKEKWFNLKISRLFYKFEFLYDKILVNSEDLKKFVIVNQNVRNEKITVIPNIIDLQNITINISEEKIRAELNLSKDDVMILSVGRLHKQKGYDILIEVAKKLKSEKIKKLENKKDICFIVIGEGKERKVLEKKVIKYDLSDLVKFIGYKENIYDYINACDIFLLTSLWEGSPNVLLEAISFNKSVISTSVEGVRELIENLPNCFIIPLREDRLKVVDDIVEKISYLSVEKEKIKNNYSNIIEKHFVWNISEKFLNLYNLV